MNLNEMTNDELLKLKQQRYKNAQEDGTISKLYVIGKELGNNLNDRYGPKYRWINDGIAIYVDDYGNYMTVRSDDKLLCSTHPCDRLIILGEWIEKVLKFYPEAEKIREEKIAKREQKEREKLLEQIV
jgi:hypothetical protein